MLTVLFWKSTFELTLQKENLWLLPLCLVGVIGSVFCEALLFMLLLELTL